MCASSNCTRYIDSNDTSSSARRRCQFSKHNVNAIILHRNEVKIARLSNHWLHILFCLAAFLLLLLLLCVKRYTLVGGSRSLIYACWEWRRWRLFVFFLDSRINSYSEWTKSRLMAFYYYVVAVPPSETTRSLLHFSLGNYVYTHILGERKKEKKQICAAKRNVLNG